MAAQIVSPSSANIVRGGSRVKFKRTGELNYLDLGCLTDFGATKDQEISEFFTGRDGSRVLKRRRTDTTSITWGFTTVERTFENLRAWFGGDAAGTSTQTAGSLVPGPANIITTVMTDITAFGAIVLNRYYKITDLTTWLQRLDKTSPMTVANLVEGTDFVVDYEHGMIAFITAPAADEEVGVTWLGWTAAQGSTFNINKNTDIQGELLVENVLEDQDVLELYTLPLGRLEAVGTGSVNIDDDSPLEFQFVQLKHATLDWGDAAHLNVG